MLILLKKLMYFILMKIIIFLGISSYSIDLGSKKGIHINAYIDKVCWSNNCIVALQYDLVRENDYNSYEVPDFSNKNYYIIKLENDELIGPLSIEEFKKNECSNVPLIKTYNYVVARWFYKKINLGYSIALYLFSLFDIMIHLFG